MHVLDKETRASKLVETELSDSRRHMQLIALGGEPHEAGREMDDIASKRMKND